MVTLAGLEPATSPAPGENKDALSPLELAGCPRIGREDFSLNLPRAARWIAVNIAKLPELVRK